MLPLLPKQIAVAFFCCFCLQCTSASYASAPAKQKDYFLTITFHNAPYGTVDALLPGHKTSLLLGRVLQRAQSIQYTREKINVGSIYGTTHSGFTLATGTHASIHFAYFCSPATHKPNTCIATDLHLNQSILKQIFHQQPPQAMLMQHGTVFAFPADYLPAYNDTIAVRIPLPPNSPLPGMLQNYANAYAAAASKRARLWRLPVVNGIVTVHTRLPAREPDPIYAVAFLIDNSTYDLRNVAPYRFRWNSRKAQDGEHILEVDALNQTGKVITRKVTLVLVQNHLQQPSPQLH